VLVARSEREASSNPKAGGEEGVEFIVNDVEEDATIVALFCLGSGYKLRFKSRDALP
jgi:hypothetical protein